MPDIIVTDMAGATIEHSTVIVNFVAQVKKQLKDSLCRVYSDNVQYKWNVGDVEKVVIPDASINCQIKSKKGNSFINTPRFVLEVLSPSTEKYDRTGKMELYKMQEIDEYWIVDWRKRQVEIYTLDYTESGDPEYYLFEIIKEENKRDLKIVHFPNVQMDFDELFDIE